VVLAKSDSVCDLTPVMFVLLTGAAGKWHRFPSTQTFLQLRVVEPSFDENYKDALLTATHNEYYQAQGGECAMQTLIWSRACSWLMSRGSHNLFSEVCHLLCLGT
jgi:hypothetical protein